MTQLNDTYLRCIRACQECILRCEECIKSMASEPSHNDCPVCCHECAGLSALRQRNGERYPKRKGDLCSLRSGVRLVRRAVWRPPP